MRLAGTIRFYCEGTSEGAIKGWENRRRAPVFTRIGEDPGDPPRNVPSTDWSGRDLQDSEKYVTEKTIKKDYVPANMQDKVRVYRSYVPMEDIPTPGLAEETDEEGPGTGYDWSEYSRRSSFIPVKLEVSPVGEVKIIDGNHRLRFFGEANFTHAPAWVVDYRKKS